MREKSVSFEKSIERLDAIVRSLEQGNVPLEQALKLFQEGTDGAPVETEYTRDE